MGSDCISSWSLLIFILCRAGYYVVQATIAIQTQPGVYDICIYTSICRLETYIILTYISICSTGNRQMIMFLDISKVSYKYSIDTHARMDPLA